MHHINASHKRHHINASHHVTHRLLRADVLVNSPLGCYDGDIYSRYFEAVKAAPHAQGIPPYFEEHIKPLTSRL